MTLQQEIPTSLGYPLVKNESGWQVNLTGLKVFKGLSVLGGIIGEMIADRLAKTPADLTFLYRINSAINPELIDLGILHVQVFGRSELIRSLIANHSSFTDDLITVLGTLQRPSWRLRLHPGDGDTAMESSVALIFPFAYQSENGEQYYNVKLERAISGEQPDQYFLRISYEDKFNETICESDSSRLVVDDLINRVYISGSTRMAGSIRDSVLNARNRGVKEHIEENKNFSPLFLQLEKTGLGRLEKLVFTWDNDFSRYIADLQTENALLIFKKLFLSLEAGSVCRILVSGETISVRLGGCVLNLYLSQLNRVLNIAVNIPRREQSENRYLRRMPRLEELALGKSRSHDFQGIKIFLIHHLTSEIVALIEALRLLSADSIHTVFVKYGGAVPTDYLDTLLAFPADYLITAGVTRKTTKSNRNYFTLSKYLSDTSAYSTLESALVERKLDFLPAMTLVAGHLFLKMCLEAVHQRKRVLLVEDGGYMSPVLTSLMAENATVADAFRQFELTMDPPEGLLSDWLGGVLLGTVEHTKNGYDRLSTAIIEAGSAKFPSFSIAISNNKLKEESQEVAHSILSAIESILHGNGLVLSQRKVLLLGAAGNIGQFLNFYLENGRLHQNALPLINVDLAYQAETDNHYDSIEMIPEEDLMNIDLFLGVTGTSLLKPDIIENLILNGKKHHLFFASGSTKTVEFTDLTGWIADLFESNITEIHGIPVETTYDRIIDPVSGLDQGGQVMIRFEKSGRQIEKVLYLLNDLTPVNFLYYGVPTETMDIVLRQLLSVSLGLTYNVSNGIETKPGLYAVDHQIDEWGKPL